MRSFRHERSRLLDVLISVVAGSIILLAINVRAIWQWVRDREEALTGQVRVTDSVVVRDGVDMLDRWLRALEMHAYDQRMALRAQFNPRRDLPQARDRLTFVEVDDHSLLRHGRWPWPRSLQAEAISTLKRLGCRAVLTDIEYPEPSAGGPGAVHPDEELASALAAPSDVPRESRPGPPDGAAFGVAFLDLAGSGETRRRDHLRRRLTEWAVHAAGRSQARLPEGLRRELVMAGEAQPDESAASALALVRLLLEEPMATSVDVLLAGVLKDLTPPRVPGDLANDSPQHFSLVLQAALNAVAAEPEASMPRLVELTMRSLNVAVELKPGQRGHEYNRRYLPELLRFFQEKRDRIELLSDRLDKVRSVLVERWIREAKQRDPRADAAALSRLVGERMRLIGDERTLLGERVQQHRASMDIVWGRDLHPAPAGGLLERLPIMGDLSPPIPTLAAAYRGIGISTVERDEGGVVRSQRLVFRVESSAGDPAADANHARLAFHASIPALAFLRDLDLDRADAGADFLRLPAKRGGADVVIPVDRSGRAIIDFRGKWHEDGFESVNAGQLLLLSQRWKDRERYLRKESDYAMRATALDFLRRWTHPRGGLPLPYEAPFAPAVTALGDAAMDAVLAAPTLEAEKIAREILFKLSLNINDLLDGLAEARAKGNAADVAEAQALIQQERQWYDTLVTELPQLEACLRPRVKGRLCLFGVTSTGTTDVSATPLQEQYVNIGVHANLIDQMLRGVFLFRPPWTHVDMWLLLAYLTLVPLVVPAISIRKGFFAVALLVLCHMAVSSLLLIVRGVWIDATTPVLALFTAYTLITIRRYIMEERSKIQIRGMFSTYLDRRVVELMLADEAAYKDLGGTTREITAFFSDIEGFTSISELLEPDELSDMLQRYLTPMTDSILQRGGLRDKYIGDAIVAMFGAPYPSTDHAAQACLSSIEQMEKLARLKQDWVRDEVAWYRKIRAAGIDLNFRIGLNTGRAKVGNFGAEHAKNYTMIGDTVNLASRLEGANKGYKSRIMISETTYVGARGVIEGRELDLLRVVGKLQPVTVFEVMGRKGEVEPARLAMIGRFAEALALYRARRFDQARGRFAEIHREFPDDGPTRVYLKRLDDTGFLASLPEDWDGAFISKEK